MRKVNFFFIIMFLFFGCKKKENCFEITDSYLNRVNENNAQEIIKGYLKEDFENLVSDTIYQVNGDKPNIFLINYNKNQEMQFSSLKSDEKYWCSNFSKKLNSELSPYFGVSNRNFSIINDEYDEIIGLKYSGCFPHNCPNKGFFFYSFKNENGYINIFSDDKKIEKFPFGLPEDKNILFDFEKIMISEMSNNEDFQNFLQLPWDRKIPAFSDKKEFPETDMISMIFNRMDKDFNVNEYNIGYNYFMFDYDQDQTLDILFRLTQNNDDSEYNYSKMKNGYYVYSGNKNVLKYIDFEYKKDDLESLDNIEFPSREIFFTELNNQKFLIITTQMQGNFNGSEMKFLNFFKISNDEFIKISNENEIKQYKKELFKRFKLDDNLYIF